MLFNCEALKISTQVTIMPKKSKAERRRGSKATSTPNASASVSASSTTSPEETKIEEIEETETKTIEGMPDISVFTSCTGVLASHPKSRDVKVKN